MNLRQLVYLGPVDPRPAGPLLHEGAAIEPGAVCPLEHRRSPWSDRGENHRVIVGSHRARADVLLEGEGILAEHLRVYFARDEDGETVVRPLAEDSMTVDDRAIAALEWVTLVGGEALTVGPWRWRFELVEESGR